MGTPRIDALDKNYLINGAFDFFQRALTASALSSVGAYHAADRWRTEVLNQTFTVRRATDLPAWSKSKYSLEFNTVPAIGGIDRQMTSEQRIESIFANDLASNPVSLRLSHKSQSALELRVVLAYADVVDDFSAVTTIYDEVITIPNDGSWYELKRENVVLPALAKNGVSLKLTFQNTDLLVAASHFVADAQLNIGTKAKVFSRAGREPVEELSLCQRYFEKSQEPDTEVVGGTTNANIVTGYSTNNGGLQRSNSVFFKQLKRITPTVSTYSPGTLTVNDINRESNGGAPSNVQWTVGRFDVESFWIGLTGTSGIGNYLFDYIADAEL